MKEVNVIMNISKFNKLDYSIYLIIVFFMLISCATIYSAQKSLPYLDNFALKQAIWFIFGLVISTIVYFFDFEQIKKISTYLYFLGISVLTILMFSPESIAPEIKGIKAWFSFPGIGSIQPSEFMKIFLILFLAKVIVDHHKKNIDKSIKTDLKLLSKIIFVTLLPLGLVLQQPDTGTGLVLVAIMIGMIFVSSIDWKVIVLLVSIGLIILTTLVMTYLYNSDIFLLFLDQYQLDRIHSWIDPFADAQGIGYQLSQSILSIGSGEISGAGYKEANVYVPEAHSDFIFTVLAAEFGFLGSSLITCLYFLLFYRMFVIAFKSKGVYEILIAAGVSSMLTFHIFENIGMVTGLVPITGIPLPLLSYGGSSILSTILALTIVINISINTKNYMFDRKEN